MKENYNEFYGILSEDAVKKNIKYLKEEVIKDIGMTKILYLSNKNEESFNELRILYERSISFLEKYDPECSERLSKEYEEFMKQKVSF